jgi:hypothetical protein
VLKKTKIILSLFHVSTLGGEKVLFFEKTDLFGEKCCFSSFVKLRQEFFLVNGKFFRRSKTKLTRKEDLEQRMSKMVFPNLEIDKEEIASIHQIR